MKYKKSKKEINHKIILIATVLAIGLTTAGGYVYAVDNEGKKGYGGHGMMMGGGSMA